MLKLSRYNISVPLPGNRLELFNTLWQSRVSISKRQHQQLTSCESELTVSVLGTGLQSELLANGMLVSCDVDELDIVRRQHEQERRGGDALYLTIATTLACNLRCGYCAEQGKRPLVLNVGDERQIMKFVKVRLAGRRTLQVTWFGGEPLLAKKSIQRLSHSFIRSCTFQGIAYSASLISNGVLIKEDTAQMLRQAQVRTVRVTLDGPRVLHDIMRPAANGKGSYTSVLAGLETASRYFDVSLGINIDRRNANGIEELLQDLVKRDLSGLHVFFARITPPDMGANKLGAKSCNEPLGEQNYLTVPEFAEVEVSLTSIAASLGFKVDTVFGQQGALPCSAISRDSYVLEPRGQVKRCYSDVTDAAATVGTIHDGNFQAIVKDKQWQDYDALDSECRECNFLPVCYGGCPKLRMNKQKKISYACTPRRFNFPEMVKAGIAG